MSSCRCKSLIAYVHAKKVTGIILLISYYTYNCVIIILFNSTFMVKADVICITPWPLLESHIDVTSTSSLILPPFSLFPLSTLPPLICIALHFSLSLTLTQAVPYYTILVVIIKCFVWLCSMPTSGLLGAAFRITLLY